MTGTSFMDEIDCGSFFDHIDDLLDYPPEEASNEFLDKEFDALPSIWADSSDVFSGNSASDISAELPVPHEEIAQLEWLSNFVEDSFSGRGIAAVKPSSVANKNSSRREFKTSSPDSSSSSSAKTTEPVLNLSVFYRNKPGRARSKRPRPATFNPRVAIQLLCSSPESEDCSLSAKTSDDEDFVESRSPKMVVSEEQKERKKMKLSSIPHFPVLMKRCSQVTGTVRKCTHCEITKTPQWRTGPMGPKSLCNACGVRYKSGRLFPEYRPAASPTFTPVLHSNSHRKVLEMRNRSVEEMPPPMVMKMNATASMIGTAKYGRIPANAGVHVVEQAPKSTVDRVGGVGGDDYVFDPLHVRLENST